MAPTNGHDFPRLDLAAVSRLDFDKPDLERFPSLRLAREVLQTGRGCPTILNAANEIAVEAFLHSRVGFLEISRIVERCSAAWKFEDRHA